MRLWKWPPKVAKGQRRRGEEGKRDKLGSHSEHCEFVREHLIGVFWLGHLPYVKPIECFTIYCRESI